MVGKSLFQRPAILSHDVSCGDWQRSTSQQSVRIFKPRCRPKVSGSQTLKAKAKTKTKEPKSWSLRVTTMPRKTNIIMVLTNMTTGVMMKRRSMTSSMSKILSVMSAGIISLKLTKGARCSSMDQRTKTKGRAISMPC